METTLFLMQGMRDAGLSPDVVGLLLICRGRTGYPLKGSLPKTLVWYADPTKLEFLHYEDLEQTPKLQILTHTPSTSKPSSSQPEDS